MSTPPLRIRVLQLELVLLRAFGKGKMGYVCMKTECNKSDYHGRRRHTRIHFVLKWFTVPQILPMKLN